MTELTLLISSQRRPLRLARPVMLTLAILASHGCDARDPRASGRAELARGEAGPAECYSLAVAPPLGILEEDSQAFVALDEEGRLLLDAIPDEYTHSIGRSMQAAYIWAGGQPQAITFADFFQTHGLDMNDRGEILVVASQMAAPWPPWTDAFVWKDGRALAHFSAPEGLQFEFGWINELGHVALSTSKFTAEGSDTVPPRAFLWRDGEVFELGEGQVHALNDADEIAGFDPGAGTVVRWRDRERTKLQTLCDSPLTESDWGLSVLLDAHGRIAAFTACEETVRSMIWEEDDVRVLPKLKGQVFFPRDMNDNGEIVGYVDIDVELGIHAPVLWDGDELVEIPLPKGATRGLAGSINNHGVLIGAFEGGFFVGSASGTQALPLESEIESSAVGRINDHGDIVNTLAGEHFFSQTTLLWRPTACK